MKLNKKFQKFVSIFLVITLLFATIPMNLLIANAQTSEFSTTDTTIAIETEFIDFDIYKAFKVF